MMWKYELNRNKIYHDEFARPLVKSFNLKKIWILVVFLVFFCIVVMKNEQKYEEISMREAQKIKKYDGTWRNLTQEEMDKLSVLGRILYLEEERPPQNDRDYLVLFWKYGNYLKNRHLNHFSSETYDPLEGCSVRNCKFSFDDHDLNKADIVIFHLHRMQGLKDLPDNHNNPNQIWAFLTDESPYHTFLNGKMKISEYDGKFNWSMTYRMDSEIPVPYGRARKFTGISSSEEKSEHLKKRRDKLVTVLGSNCGGQNHRWQYVKKLQQFIDVDVYGKCGNKTACPGHFKSDCPAIDDYLFYLSFENSDCKEYLTEKIFWNGYHKKSIPVIMGYDKKIYRKLLPPHSFLHIDDFAKPKDLAEFILFLNRTSEYKEYYKWTKNYEIVNEHGYFKSNSYHFCRICEAMNFNKKKPHIYEKLDKFWNKSKDCSVREK